MKRNGSVTLEMLYQKLQSIEEEVKEINDDLHTVRPAFVEKLKKIEAGKFRRFRNLEEMEKYLDES